MYSRDALLSPPFLQLHPFSLGSEMSTQHYKFDRILFISSLSFVHISFRLAESSLRKSTWKKREKHISDFNSKMQKVFCSIKWLESLLSNGNFQEFTPKFHNPQIPRFIKPDHIQDAFLGQRVNHPSFMWMISSKTSGIWLLQATVH